MMLPRRNIVGPEGHQMHPSKQVRVLLHATVGGSSGGPFDQCIYPENSNKARKAVQRLRVFLCPIPRHGNDTVVHEKNDVLSEVCLQIMVLLEMVHRLCY